MFKMNGDIKFFYDGNKPADIRLALSKTELLRDEALETAVLISLFSDARAGDEDTLPDKNGNRRGWWGDSLNDISVGSKYWILGRTKITSRTTDLIEQYTQDALAWLVSDGVADRVEVEARRNGIYRIDTAVKIVKTDNTNVFFRFFLNWESQIYGGF